MNFVCLIMVDPICFPVLGSQIMTFPDLSPDATLVSLGAHAKARTHPGCPLHSKCGVSVVKSQNRTVASPDPEAEYKEPMNLEANDT